jgi:pyridoxal phosphate enzyme (YggS family)
MTSIAANLQAVRARIAAACVAAGRPPESVQLLAVSKTWPAAGVREAAMAGQRAFGESYVQEAVDKVAELAALQLEWHFIGPLQSNKTRQVAENFSWVHSVDRLKIAERLSAQRPPQSPPLQVCVQVNLSGEATKSGCLPDQAAALAQDVAALPGLRLRGLMAIPEPGGDLRLQRGRFALLRKLREQAAARGLGLDTLSMGMSDDLEAAIMEGATIVRVGTAIFGQRN